MSAIAKRVERLERENQSKAECVFITYAENETTEAKAVAEWEVNNGPVSDDDFVFMTVYEARP